MNTEPFSQTAQMIDSVRSAHLDVAFDCLLLSRHVFIFIFLFNLYLTSKY